MPSGEEQRAYKKRLEEIGEAFDEGANVMDTLKYMREMALQLAELEYEGRLQQKESRKVIKEIREGRQLLF